MIDWGFVFGAFVPCKLKFPCWLPRGLSSSLTLKLDVVAAACHNGHYSTIWRVSLAIGCVFPMVLFLLRLRLKEPEEFSKESMKKQTPYLLVFRFYGFRLAAVSIIWFLYDVSCPLFSSSSIYAKSIAHSPSF